MLHDTIWVPRGGPRANGWVWDIKCTYSNDFVGEYQAEMQKVFFGCPPCKPLIMGILEMRAIYRW
jgi:hypothetical protein